MKKEGREEKTYNDIAPSLPLSRREFFKRIGVLGGGIIVYLSVGDPAAIAQPPGGKGRRRFGQQGSADFNAILRIGADGKVACFTGKIEMGQGVITSLAQMAAEELDVPYNSVEMVMGDTDLCPWDMGTWGSMTTRFFGPMLREAAAEAKAVLMELAAEHLKMPVEQLKTKDGIIFDKTQTGNRLTYGQLTKGKRIERNLKKKPSLKDVAEFTVSGEPFLRRDALDKVTGKAKYAGDIRLPEMLYARILRPPAHGARLKKVDTSGAKHMKGVLVVQDGDLIAVLHKNPDEAEKALSRIKADFDLPKTNLNDKNIFEHLLKVAPDGNTETRRGPHGGGPHRSGNLEVGKKLASEIFDAIYLNSYVAHAPIETHTAIAKIENNNATVWASTQSPFGVKEQVARALALPPDNVHVKPIFVGGGFGGKSSNIQAIEAARLAKLTGKPVQVAWNRAEEFFYDTFRPAAVVKITSGINDLGNIVLWDYNVYFAGSDGAALFYNISHHSAVAHGEWFGGSDYHPFGTGAWRAPATNTNTFARESHIDIMASKAGKDPLEFRLNHLSDRRMRRVLKAAANKFGWKPSKAPSGRGYGVACGIRSGAYVATMAEVEVDKPTGKVKVKRVILAQDMGLVINPEGAKLQIEGCVTMGLGYALTEEIHFRDGEIFDLNFDTYDIPLFSWLPEIKTVLIKDDHSPPQGGGEPAIICMGAVIANAIYDKTGARLFQLPMTSERVKEAMKNS
ncbi:MAG: xanthine dehydrogenase family protein molybdopterin-binding subunit [Deltaproteobacteria bacterium]|nr:xanthine dehydrogenase family protein molybdopterin-binding subunit [Deltaproteobacteria bacterium]